MKKISQELEESIVREYNLGSGTCELAKKFDLNRWTILKYLKLNGIIAERITRPYKNKFNINYFSSYNNEAAYWAGFIFADGNIHTKKQILQIALHKQDEGHLLKFAKSIDFTGPIYTDIQNDSKKISVSGKWFAKDLLDKYNICSKKSLTIQFPKQVPEAYVSHFIRGIFDGDGCIQVNKHGTPIISFIGNKAVITAIRNICLGLINKEGTDFSPIHSHWKSALVGQISFSAKNAKIIADWMYNNSTNNIRLNRKHSKYLNIWS